MRWLREYALSLPILSCLSAISFLTRLVWLMTNLKVETYATFSEPSLIVGRDTGYISRLYSRYHRPQLAILLAVDLDSQTTCVFSGLESFPTHCDMCKKNFKHVDGHALSCGHNFHLSCYSPKASLYEAMNGYPCQMIFEKSCPVCDEDINQIKEIAMERRCHGCHLLFQRRPVGHFSCCACDI